jgi:hypothetical protein
MRSFTSYWNFIEKFTVYNYRPQQGVQETKKLRKNQSNYTNVPSHESIRG